MAWAFVNKGTAAFDNGTGSLTLSYPAGLVTGNILFLWATWGPAAATITVADAGFQIAHTRTTNMTSTLFWKIIDGSEGANTTVTKSGIHGQGVAQMAQFSGGPTSLASNVVNTASGGGGAVTGLNYQALTVAEDNLLILSLGTKAANCFGFNVPSEFDAAVDEAHSSNGICLVWDYKIQTAQTNIAGGSWTISTDVSTTRQNMISSYRGAPAPVISTLGFVPIQGSPSLQGPGNPNQFQGVVGYTSAANIPADLGGGVSIGHSTTYGQLSLALPNIGFIPQAGPGNYEPFNLNQFLAVENDSGNPSPTGLDLIGIANSHSVTYGATASSTASLSGLAVSHSTSFGLATGVSAGNMTGIAVSHSVGYAAPSPIGQLTGLAVSHSVSAVNAVGGNFQPLIPYTAVVDVRLNIGYQPWRIHPDGTIG